VAHQVDADESANDQGGEDQGGSDQGGSDQGGEAQVDLDGTTSVAGQPNGGGEGGELVADDNRSAGTSNPVGR
jgi:hypothetical protein